MIILGCIMPIIRTYRTKPPCGGRRKSSWSQQTSQQMSVQSELGRGTTFTVLLPHQLTLSTTPQPPKIEEPRTERGLRVLLVDDEEAVLQVMRHVLERAGYQTHSEVSAREALARVRSSPGAFDAAVLDYTMPVMVGTDLARELHQLHPGLPIVLSTGRPSAELRRETRAAGASGVLTKPFRSRQLLQAVKDALGRQPAASAE